MIKQLFTCVCVIFLSFRILSNQLPSSLVKKLLLVACGGVEVSVSIIIIITNTIDLF